MTRSPVPNAPLGDLRASSAAVRRWVVEQAYDSGVGHVGSALSVVETLTALWGGVLRAPGTDDPDRDRFILAKGHAALAYFAVLRLHGLIDARTFRTYCRDGSSLGVHPEAGLPGVEVSTGSLGQGLSVGCGLAVALRRRKSLARVFVLMSDAECNEGQVWEAAMFAAHQKLHNLVAVVDVNGMQALGRTGDVLDLSPLSARWSAFGWHVVEAEGHDEQALISAFTSGIENRRGPAVVLARTVLGKGVSFMEDRLEWHYRNLSPELASEALSELDAAEVP
jgi:transketolase